MMEYDEDTEVANFVWNHFSQFFTAIEQEAYWAVVADKNEAIGHKQYAEWVRLHKLAHDPAVMAELSEGTENFCRRAVDRVLRQHADEIAINRCPKCSRVVRTPKARQCFWCGFDWHSSTH